VTNLTMQVQNRGCWWVRWCLVLAAVLLASTVRMEADPVLPNFTALTECVSGQQGVVDTSGGCSQTGVDGEDSITLSTFPFASLQTQALVVAGVQDSFSGFAALNYSFEVVGGNPGDQVPVLIATNLSANTNVGPAISDGYAFSELVVTTDSNGPSGASIAICSSGCGAGSGSTSFSGALSTQASSGAIGTVHLEVEASASSLPGLGITANASADPYIYIDPSFARAAGYSILVSPDVGNGIPTATPEPGSLSLGAIGMCAILAAHRRWRKARFA
jgi:hypothetical protein